VVWEIIQAIRFIKVLFMAVRWILLALVWATASLARGDVTAEAITASAGVDSGPHVKDVETAISRFRARDVEAARTALESARKKNSKLGPPEVMLAQLFYVAGQGAAGRAELEKAARRVPGDPEAFLLMGESASGEGRLTDATLLFEKAAATMSGVGENAKRKRILQGRLYSGLAAIDESRRDWAAAREHIAAWLKADPDSAPAHQRMGRVLYELKEIKEAYKELQLACKADPKLTPPEVTLAVLYSQAGDTASTDKWMNVAMKKAAEDFALQLALANWLLQSNRLEEAQERADKALKLDPGSLDAKLTRGVIAHMHRDLKSAKTYLEAGHLQSPLNFLAINQLALVLIEEGNEPASRRALEFAELNSRLNPNKTEATATLGWIHYRMGHSAEAERAFGAVMNTGSLHAEAAYFLANLLRDQGRTDQATGLLDSALSSERPFVYRREAQDLLTKLNTKPKKESPATPKK